MQISGFVKQSLMDYPGKFAAVIFTQGCNFRCPYCHNQELIPFLAGTITEEFVFAHLEKNRLLLDGLVITGGEPSVQPDLYSFIRKVKALGLLVKLDTNGSNPEVLKQLLEAQLVDYVAMDIKSALTKEDYSTSAGVVFSSKKLNNIRESIRYIIDSGIEHEFRTTVCSELISPEHIKSILPELKGAKRYYLQRYHNTEKIFENKNHFSAYSIEKMQYFIESSAEVPIFIRD